MKKSHVPACLMAAATTIATRFGGKRPPPVLVITGDASSQDILTFQNLVLDKVSLGKMRQASSDHELIGYLQGDRQIDAIFYRDSTGAPTKRAQAVILGMMKDEKKRHFMPLLLVAVNEDRETLRVLRGDPLAADFVQMIGTREVSIAAPHTGRTPVWKQLTSLFLGALTRKSDLRLEPDAAELVENALKSGATISNDAVIEVVKTIKERAVSRGSKVIDRNLVWDAFPDQFRNAVQPLGVAVH